jgi:hypothetical protein
MWFLRLAGGLLVVAIGVLLAASALTGRRDYLQLAWRLFRYGILFALAVFALMAVERLLIITL